MLLTKSQLLWSECNIFEFNKITQKARWRVFKTFRIFLIKSVLNRIEIHLKKEITSEEYLPEDSPNFEDRNLQKNFKMFNLFMNYFHTLTKTIMQNFHIRNKTLINIIFVMHIVNSKWLILVHNPDRNHTCSMYWKYFEKLCKPQSSDGLKKFIQFLQTYFNQHHLKILWSLINTTGTSLGTLLQIYRNVENT